MSIKIRWIVNSVLGSLIFLVILDHFSSFTYRNLFRSSFIIHTSQYMEIISLLITISVPFFYGLYKHRENRLEEKAVGKHGGVSELHNARLLFDRRAFIFYLIAGSSLIGCLYVQSLILNADKVETEIQERRINEIYVNLQLVKTTLEQKTEEIRNIIQSESQSVEQIKAKLDDAAKSLLTIGTHIGSTIAMASSETSIQSFTDLNRLSLQDNINTVLVRLDSLESHLLQTKVSQQSSLKSFVELNNLISKINQELVQIKNQQITANQPEPVPTAQPPDSTSKPIHPDFKSTVMDNLSANIVFCLCGILDDYEKENGLIPPLQPQKEAKDFYDKFKGYIEVRWGINKDDLSAILKTMSKKLEQAQKNFTTLEQELPVANLAKKLHELQWLRWRLGFVIK